MKDKCEALLSLCFDRLNKDHKGSYRWTMTNNQIPKRWSAVKQVKENNE